MATQDYRSSTTEPLSAVWDKYLANLPNADQFIQQFTRAVPQLVNGAIPQMCLHRASNGAIVVETNDTGIPGGRSGT